MYQLNLPYKFPWRYYSRYISCRGASFPISWAPFDQQIHLTGEFQFGLVIIPAGFAWTFH